MLVLLAAALWGLAEATFFFLVPDVLLSGVAILDWRLALAGCAAALAGAIVGGAGMFIWARRRPAAARHFLLGVPGIHAPMLERVATEVAARPHLAVLTGPLSGTPYKCYAVEAARQHRSLSGFLLISVPARVSRFLAVTALAAWLSAGVFDGLPASAKLVAWLAAWSLFYLAYFRAMRRQGR